MTAKIIPPELAAIAELLAAPEAAALLSISARHLIRLADSGRAPAPVRLGAAVRWCRAALLAWLESGCPDCRKGAK